MRDKIFKNTVLPEGGGSWNIYLPAPSSHWLKSAPGMYLTPWNLWPDSYVDSRSQREPVQELPLWKLGLNIFRNYPFRKCGEFPMGSWANATCLPGLYSPDFFLLCPHTSQK